MSKEKRWTQCSCCDNWQPIRDDEAFTDIMGNRWQQCEFCETDSGPRIIMIDGYDYDEQELTKEELKEYEQRTNHNK
jgi:hypothetical protein